ncbi:Uncharacterized protein FWK35_00037147 [Aphis craccivora]|uniref:Uncharacterized protein n=1 Tax=Aphis craccivora TaxID=307492 RepID=A0A6G0VQK5_APHCR|nr:Uncharacterized protein FWK35_00037147 [Aphis craccivora]
MRYPSSVPSSSISYTSVKASFSGKIPTVTNIDDSHNLKYFLEKVVFQHVADDIVKSMQPNISIAVREAVKPYIIFKNVSNPHFKGFTASTPSNLQIVVGDPDVFANGLNQTLLRVRNMTVDMAKKKLLSSTELAMHNLSGTFRLKLTNGTKEYTGYADFEIENINVAPVSNMFDRNDCTSPTIIKNTKVTIDDPASFNLNTKEDELEVIKALEDGFSDTTKKKFEKAICNYLANMLNSKAGDF